MNYSKKMLLTALVCGSTMYTGTALAAEAAAEVPAEKTAEAEVAEFVLEPMLVTATRTEKNIFQVPANATVITKEELHERNINNVNDALKTKAGIYISPATDPYGNVQIRGFGSQDILFLQDGTPLNNAWNGQPDLNLIPVESIERIEVVRGAGSALYGGRAVGGVVNIITKEASKQLSGDVTLTYGSNSTWKKAVNIGTKLDDKWSFNVGYEKRQTDGFSGYRKTASPGASGTPVGTINVPQMANGDYLVGERGERKTETENVSFAVKYNFDKNKSLKYTYSHAEYEYSYNNPRTYVTMGGQPFWGVANKTYTTQNGDKIKFGAYNFLGYNGLRKNNLHTLNYTDKKNQWIVNASYQDIYRDGYSEAPSTASSINYQGEGNSYYYPNKNISVDMLKTWELKKHTLTAGANYKNEEIKRMNLKVSNWRDPESTSGWGGTPLITGGKARSISVFIQDEYNFNKYFTMYVGGRIDSYKKYDGYNDAVKIPSTSFTEFSPKAVFEWHPQDTTSYYISYGHSFNTPTLFQLYRDANSGMSKTYPNPDLKPEKTDTFELGFKKKIKKTKLGTTLFYSKTKDAIFLVPYSGRKRYENCNEGKRRGFELEVSHEFDKHWSTYLNYTWQKGENSGRGMNNMIQQNNEIPRHLFQTGIEYNQGKFTGVLDGMFVSARQASDAITGEYGSEDPYFVMNLYLNYKFTKEWSVQFGIDNVLDRKFYASEAIQGRTYNLGLRYEF